MKTLNRFFNLLFAILYNMDVHEAHPETLTPAGLLTIEEESEK